MLQEPYRSGRGQTCQGRPDNGESVGKLSLSFTSFGRSSAVGRLASTLLAVALCTAFLTMTATPAQAAGCAPIIDKVTVRDVVIYGTSASRATTTVVTHDPCTDDEWGSVGISDVSGEVYLSDGDSWGIYYNTSTTTTWSGASGAYFDKYSAVGRGSETVEVYDNDYNRTYRDGLPFYVRRNVVVNSFNASPEPVRKGSAIKVSGVVQRLSVNSYGDAKYVPYVSKLVNVYFRPSTSTQYTKVSYATTTSTGYFSRNITATVDGCWKVYSTQTAYNVGRWSGADCVDVL